MIVYMLRSLDTGKYYNRTGITRWVKQDEADVWSEKWAAACNKQKVQIPCEIVPFILEEIT